MRPPRVPRCHVFQPGARPQSHHTEPGAHLRSTPCRHPHLRRRYGYYQQDADTFAKWKVDYVKFDGCDQPEGHTAKELTCNMSEALLKTGTDFWFNFHCWQVSIYRRRFI